MKNLKELCKKLSNEYLIAFCILDINKQIFYQYSPHENTKEKFLTTLDNLKNELSKKIAAILLYENPDVVIYLVTHVQKTLNINIIKNKIIKCMDQLQIKSNQVIRLTK